MCDEVRKKKLLYYLVNPSVVAITPAYDAILLEKDGYFVVKSGDSYGAIDKDGKMVIPVENSVLFRPSEGLFCVQKSKGGKFGFVDASGQYVIEPRFDLAFPFAEGMALGVKGGKWGVINRQGATVVDFDWEMIKPIASKCPVLWVRSNSKWSPYDTTKSAFAFDGEYNDASSFNADNLSFVEATTGLFGMVDAQGNVVIPSQMSTEGIAQSCYDEMQKDGKTSVSKIEAYRYNAVNNPGLEDVRFSPAVPKELWNY